MNYLFTEEEEESFISICLESIQDIIIVFVECLVRMNVLISLPKILVQVALLLLLALSNEVRVNGDSDGRQCEVNPALKPRPHTVSILEFGAVGDGKTLNTIAFQNAIFYLKSFADKGGAQLYVPPGTWLTQSFNLTSHLTLFLEKGAVILGSQVFHLLPFLLLRIAHVAYSSLGSLLLTSVFSYSWLFTLIGSISLGSC